MRPLLGKASLMLGRYGWFDSSIATWLNFSRCNTHIVTKFYIRTTSFANDSHCLDSNNLDTLFTYVILHVDLANEGVWRGTSNIDGG